MVAITSVYAAVFALFFLVLSARVARSRVKTLTALGDGGDPGLLRRIRVQANAAEYGPLALLLAAMAEIQGAPGLLVHVLGLSLLGGRFLHAYGVSQENERIAIRVCGMTLTFASIAVGALALLWLGLV
ncbi:MAPEG family protein [Stappia stellulata]|uniref:MAPEG family protein n=1 Tax=Stappia stellulata TaxID=71235 RepID=UPI000408579B|nr:MAPEG family protein [Stappia stellulata]